LLIIIVENISNKQKMTTSAGALHMDKRRWCR